MRPTSQTGWRVRLAALLLLALTVAGVVPPRIARADNLPGVLVEGQVEPVRWVQLSLPFGARVETVHFVEGERAAAGDVLLTLDGGEGLRAAVAAAELELVLAGQAIRSLEEQAGVELARAEVALAAAQDEHDFRRDHLAGLERPHPEWIIDQAQANLILAREVLERAREDLEKARQKFANKKSFIWMFINERYVRLTLTGMEAQVAYYERRAIDAQEKVDDLLAPVDPILLEQARAAESLAAARLEQARNNRDELLDGPDPDRMAAAQARLGSAAANLEAARAALESVELRAPFDGEVALLDVQAGEWIFPGTRIALLADLGGWQVVTSDLPEESVAGVQAGQLVEVTLDAFPGQTLSGQVESIALQGSEDDGDVYYSVKVRLGDVPRGVRWGMRARLRF